MCHMHVLDADARSSICMGLDAGSSQAPAAAPHAMRKVATSALCMSPAGMQTALAVCYSSAYDAGLAGVVLRRAPGPPVVKTTSTKWECNKRIVSDRI